MSSREDILKIDETPLEEEVQFHEEDQPFGSPKSKDSDGFDKLPEDDDVDPEGSKVPNPRTSSSSGARTGPTTSKTVTFMPDKPTMGGIIEVTQDNYVPYVGGKPNYI